MGVTIKCDRETNISGIQQWYHILILGDLERLDTFKAYIPYKRRISLLLIAYDMQLFMESPIVLSHGLCMKIRS